MTSNDVAPPRRVDDVDWDTWKPHDLATILFVIRAGEILLIHKKRGLGAGKVNGPGGRLEPRESAHECAIREVREELRITPLGVAQRGELSFQFVDGYSIHATVFVANGCEGEAQETDEATPLWAPVDRIPYERMWADDRIWLPRLLAGEHLRGRFVFDGDTMLDHRVWVVAPPRNREVK